MIEAGAVGVLCVIDRDALFILPKSVQQTDSNSSSSSNSSTFFRSDSSVVAIVVAASRWRLF